MFNSLQPERQLLEEMRLLRMKKGLLRPSFAGSDIARVC